MTDDDAAAAMAEPEPGGAGWVGRQPDRDANGETALERSERWRREARAVPSGRPAGVD